MPIIAPTDAPTDAPTVARPPIVAESYRHVVGVDTHAATHTYAIIDASSGALRHTATFPASAPGRSRALGWLSRRTVATPASSSHVGDLDPALGSVLVAIEGAGSYGATLAADLAAAGLRVVEPPTVRRARGQGKDDALDALGIARATAGSELSALRDRRGSTGAIEQVRAALAVLLTAREQLNDQRLRAINALTALVRTHDLDLDARRALRTSQISQVARWRPRSNEPLGTATARGEATRLARLVIETTTQLRENHHQIHHVITHHAPAAGWPQAAELLAQVGVGPVVAATVLVSTGHPGRVRSHAALAVIAGTAPIPASSGNTTRHRLSRGGDRRLNKALNTVALTRMRCDSTTRAYVARRRAEGKTDREIRRCLKRYITRQLYRALHAAPTPDHDKTTTQPTTQPHAA